MMYMYRSTVTCSFLYMYSDEGLPGLLSGAPSLNTPRGSSLTNGDHGEGSPIELQSHTTHEWGWMMKEVQRLRTKD